MRLAKATYIFICAWSILDCAAAVRTGLDNLDAYKEILKGKRIGIIANHTSRDRQGRYVVDVFKDLTEVAVVALFSPEHGLLGLEEAGKEVSSRFDPVYGLPVYSLYGQTTKPTKEMLKDVDILVFDIQDIGARFYTYVYTMSLAMEAAAENAKRFIVLDRPNPINGIQVEGKILEPECSSFVGMHPIPVRHGLTVGELAKMVNGEGWLANGIRADLVVVPMEGWRRRMWFDQTGLSFIKPSPNMPDLETAAIYPGLCLLEGTNVSEGRGTPRPFRQFGAPWINSEELVHRLNQLNLPALRFEAASFVPSSSKYEGQLCHGVKLGVTDRDKLEPFWSGVSVVNEIHRLYPHTFEWKAAHFDRLCGTSAIRLAITSQSSLEKQKYAWQAECAAFQQTRRKYLLYPD
jgi:uncharacterized protein YbbC (DUF1343 family)